LKLKILEIDLNVLRIDFFNILLKSNIMNIYEQIFISGFYLSIFENKNLFSIGKLLDSIYWVIINYSNL
jgi:hypothetical protein